MLINLKNKLSTHTQAINFVNERNTGKKKIKSQEKEKLNRKTQSL